MSNPKIPIRLRTDDGTIAKYPKELTYKDGLLQYTDDNGDNINLYDERLKAIEKDIEDLNYKAVSITEFKHNKPIQEYGATIASVILSWKINKIPEELYLDNSAIDIEQNGSLQIDLDESEYITKDNNKTWTLKAVDNRDAISTKTTSITFYNGVYYGKAAAPDIYDSNFILSLTRELRSNKKPSFSISTGEGEYMYYCLPKRMGECSFTVGGFTGGFILADTIEFTNASEFTETYYIYRSQNSKLGQQTVNIS